jgi:uncharacterized membrane protein
MNQTPGSGLSHPLVAAYLDELERALSSADQQERIDTLAAVREHLTEALGIDLRAGDGAEPTTEQVRAVLNELGSVEQIAASATPASSLPMPPAPTPPAEEKQEGGWAAPALLAVSIVSLMVPLYGAVLAIGCLVAAIVLLRTGAPRRGFLKATIAVSSVTLLFTAVQVVGNIAWFSASNEVTGVSSAPAVPVPVHASAPASPNG